MNPDTGEMLGFATATYSAGTKAFFKFSWGLTDLGQDMADRIPTFADPTIDPAIKPAGQFAHPIALPQPSDVAMFEHQSTDVAAFIRKTASWSSAEQYSNADFAMGQNMMDHSEFEKVVRNAFPASVDPKGAATKTPHNVLYHDIIQAKGYVSSFESLTTNVISNDVPLDAKVYAYFGLLTIQTWMNDGKPAVTHIYAMTHWGNPRSMNVRPVVPAGIHTAGE